MIKLDSIQTITFSLPALPEMLLILVIVLLLFGGRKIPELMKGLGQGIKEFKDASKGTEEKTSKSSEVTKEEK
jgi:sec-independent protein translocase protein TatA